MQWFCAKEVKKTCKRNQGISVKLKIWQMGKSNGMKRQQANCGQLGLNRRAVGTPLRQLTPTNRLFLGR